MKVLPTFGLLASLGVAGCMSPIVGAECRHGLVECNGRCVDLAEDAEHCGVCGNVCATGICFDGLCGAAPQTGGDGGGSVGHGYAGPTPDRITLPRISGPGTASPTFPPSCGLGELACDGRCVRAASDSQHCGSCGTACALGEVCAAGRCAASCELPSQQCGELCVDTARDADNCGGCGRRCETGLCADGVCQAPLAGHVVIIGHDYTERREVMSRVIGNAALLPPRRLVRVVTFEGRTSVEAREGTDAAIDQVAGEIGRTWQPVPTSSERVSYELARGDALLLYAQPDLPRPVALAIGATWRVAVGEFLRAGGTVIAAVGPGADGGTLAVLEGAGLLDGTPPRTDISGARLHVERPADALAIGLPLTYRGDRSTVRLDLPLEDAVVSDGLAPVVVHRLALPMVP